MITHDSSFTIRCDVHSDESITINAKTERTAIAKARAKGWNVLRVRAVAGVPKNKIARTVRCFFCPGCASTVGVTFR